MQIKDVNEKLKALRVAENCMNSVVAINPSAVTDEVFSMISDLKVDLIDHQYDEMRVGNFVNEIV